MVSTQKGQCTTVVSPPSPNTLNVQGDAQNRPCRWGPRLHGETLKVWSLDLQEDQGRTLREYLTQLPTQNNFPQFLVPGRGHLPGSQLPAASCQLPAPGEGRRGRLRNSTFRNANLGAGFPESSVQMQIRTGRGVTRSPGAAAWLLGRGAPEGGGKREKEAAGWRSAGGGTFQRFPTDPQGRCHSCWPGGSRAPGTSCSTDKQPRGPERQRPESPERLSGPTPPRRPVPGGGGLGGTPTSSARGGQCAGLLPRVPGPPLSPRPRQGGEGRPQERSARP